MLKMIATTAYLSLKKTDRIVLIERGDTVTENLIMAASVGKGKVEIVNASYNYIVLDLIYYLRGLGVKFSGIGTSNLVIEGCGKL
jgi:UDP-N-acetylglucosamine 1-carboxyvinyltransferase